MVLSSAEIIQFSEIIPAAARWQAPDARRRWVGRLAQQAQQTRIGLIALQAQRLTDTAALFQAMGGEWRHYETDMASAPFRPSVSD